MGRCGRFERSNCIRVACRKIVTAVRWLMGNLAGLGTLLRDVVVVVHDVAFGAMDSAKEFLSESLKKALPLLLSLFATISGVGNIAGRLRGFLTHIQTPILNVIDKVLKPVARFLRKMFRRGKGTGEEDLVAKDLRTGTDHRGSITVGGPDLEAPLKWSWATTTPPTAKEVTDALKAMRSQLTPAQDNIRDQAFAKAEKFVTEGEAAGGYVVTKSEPFEFRNDFLPDKYERVRLVIKLSKGVAFQKGA